MVKIINIDVDRIGKLVTVIAIWVKNKTTNGFESPPVKNIIKANWIISAAITNVVEVSLSLLLIE